MTVETTPQLERALTLRDLMLFNLVAVIGITWAATAAKSGPSSLTLWLLAAIFFFVPQGLAVIQLSSSYPEEGGIYAWTRKEFGEGHGFLCGWCYWINNVLYYPSLLLAAAVTAPYVFGQGESGLADKWTYVLLFTLIALMLAVVLNVLGVGTGKWLQNIGGISVYLPGILLIVLGFCAALTKAPANSMTFSQLKPDLTNLPELNLWATIALIIGICGLAITLFAMVVAIIPPAGTPVILIYEAKVAGGSLFLILIGLIIYWRAKRKQMVDTRLSPSSSTL